MNTYREDESDRGPTIKDTVTRTCTNETIELFRKSLKWAEEQFINQGDVNVFQLDNGIQKAAEKYYFFLI